MVLSTKCVGLHGNSAKKCLRSFDNKVHKLLARQQRYKTLDAQTSRKEHVIGVELDAP
jgi:hypothetical protein